MHFRHFISPFPGDARLGAVYKWPPVLAFLIPSLIPYEPNCFRALLFIDTWSRSCCSTKVGLMIQTSVC